MMFALLLLLLLVLLYTHTYTVTNVHLETCTWGTDTGGMGEELVGGGGWEEAVAGVGEGEGEMEDGRLVDSCSLSGDRGAECRACVIPFCNTSIHCCMSGKITKETRN